MIISIEYLYWLAGVLLLITAGMILVDRSHPKRWSSGLFWLLFAMVFLIGERLPTVVVGAGVVLMALIAGLGGVGRGAHAELHVKAARASAGRLGHKLFIPALAIPLTTVIGSVLLKHYEIGGVPLLDPKNTTFVSLGLGCLIALALACWLTRDTPLQALRESRRLTEALGWTMVLPQMLAMLGLLFNDAGVGNAVAHVATTYINLDFRLVAVMVYVLGMALFTVIIGYCGTLMTPMAANFNIVPAALLELPDKNAVIKAQLPTALMMLLVNIVLLYLLM